MPPSPAPASPNLQPTSPPPLPVFRTIASFFALGLLNNTPYVILLSSAQNIYDAGVGIVYLCSIFPGLLIKLTSPLWFHSGALGHSGRLSLSSALMASGLLLVGAGMGSLLLQLLGVLASSAGGSLGECSLLALAQNYGGDAGARGVSIRRCLTAFASGTGLAGVAGYAWNFVGGRVFGWGTGTMAVVAVVAVALPH